MVPVPVVPEPVPLAAFCKTRLLAAPVPPSTVPVAAKESCGKSVTDSTEPTPVLFNTWELVTAVKVLATVLLPMCRLPVRVPALMNLLPSDDPWNAIRPVMLPVAALVKVVGLPPRTEITGISACAIDTPRSAVDPMIPLLVMTLVPPAPLDTSRARPVKFASGKPKARVDVPLSVPTLLTTSEPLVPLPSCTPEVNKPSPRSRVGSTVPLLMNVVLTPVRFTAYGVRRTGLTSAPAPTVTVILLIGESMPTTASSPLPVQSTLAPSLNAVQAACAAGRKAMPPHASATACTLRRKRGRLRCTPEALPLPDEPPLRAISGAATQLAKAAFQIVR